MKSVLRQLEKQPISLGLLKKKMPSYVKCMLYDDLPSTGNIQTIMGKHTCLIVLYQTHHVRKSIGHFSAILKHGNSIEYFSSYGMRPEQEISATHSSGKLIRLLGKNYNRSSAVLQEKTHSNTCARWCAVRCLLHELPLQIFIQKFTKKVRLDTPDDLITLSTMFLFDS